MTRALILISTALAVLIPQTALADEEELEQFRLLWDELVEKYADKYSAVMVEHSYDIKLLFNAHLDLSARITERRQIAIFDAERAQEHLDLGFEVGPGIKVQKKKAWTMSYRNGVLHRSMKAKESDFSHRDLGEGWKELRMTTSGLTHQGLATFEVEFDYSGPPYNVFRFDNSLPVVRGLCVIRVPGLATGISEGKAEWVDYLSARSVGFLDELDPDTMDDREVVRAWEVRDLKPQYPERMVPAAYQPEASIYIMPRGFGWNDWVDMLHDEVKDAKAPKHLVKAAKDTLKDRPPEEIVYALARYMDDPANLKIVGHIRDPEFFGIDLEKLVRERGGNVYSKAVLASRLLKELKVKHHLVLGSSRYRSKDAWALAHSDLLDAVLIWIPSISGQFLWDVGNPWVPIGTPGSDLYDEMLVLDTKNDEPVMKFDVDPGLYKESRTLAYSLAEDGLLRGDLTCRFETFPLSQDLDPWNSSADLASLVSSALPSDFDIQDPHWKQVNWTTMRCTKETPAVLGCRIEHEALPVGDSGWEVRPFHLPLPQLLNAVLDEKRKGPLLLTEGTQISDAVFLKLDGQVTVSVPEAVERKNMMGHFYSAWEIRENGVFATRKLTLNARTLSQTEIKLARQLRQAWEDAGEQAVVIE